MKVSALALALVLTTMLAGCGLKVAAASDVTRTASASVDGNAAPTPAGHEIATTFAKENAAAAPAEMYPSF